MFLSRTPGERFPVDESQGPELRKGLDLYRVVNNTGLQVREGIELGSSPCGRIPSGDVFCVNHSSKIQHGNRYLTRLHIVEPRAGWVSGVSKWVEKFQDGRKPGPVPLKSTLDQKSIVLMKPEGWSVPGSISKDMARRNGLRSQLSSRLQKTSKACSTRSRWLHSRGGVWPVAVDSIPGPQYFPRRSATESRPEIVFIPKEKRFLSANTRHVSKEYEKQTLGSFSPGPAQYMGHNQVLPVVSSKSAPASPRQAKGIACKVSPRAVTADTVRAAKRRYRNPVRAKNAGGPRYIGFAEHDAADKYLGKAKAGSAGVYVMRIPISKSGERGVNGYFETKMGAESPGPASHFPSVSSISPRGCPVFGTPKAMDLRDWERQENSEAPDVVIPPRPAKTAQVHRRWPFSSPPIQLNNGRVPGSPGMDSPGPCTVNIANHDPFRPKSFLKTGICRPPSAHPTEKKGHRLPWKENVYLRRA